MKKLLAFLLAVILFPAVASANGPRFAFAVGGGGYSAAPFAVGGCASSALLVQSTPVYGVVGMQTSVAPFTVGGVDYWAVGGFNAGFVGGGFNNFGLGFGGGRFGFRGAGFGGGFGVGFGGAFIGGGRGGFAFRGRGR